MLKIRNNEMGKVENISRKPRKASNSASNGLTGIDSRIHSGPTQNQWEAENELDRIAIDNFLDTIAGVAMAIATREIETKDNDRHG